MGDYQVLFSGEVSRDSEVDQVRARLARELGIDDLKARALFSGRTVVIRSQLAEDEAQELQHRLADLGAICRIKSLAAPRTPGAQIDKHAPRMEGHNDQTLKDITAAHVECPRCGHLQLESSHCTRCGIDIAAALVQKRKEDLLIQKKIRELRAGRTSQPAARRREEPEPAPIHSDARAAPRKRTGFVRELFRRS
jgi:ribosomal protein L37E